MGGGEWRGEGEGGVMGWVSGCGGVGGQVDNVLAQHILFLSI